MNSWQAGNFVNILDLATVASKEPKTIINFLSACRIVNESVEPRLSNAIEFSDEVNSQNCPSSNGRRIWGIFRSGIFHQYKVQDNELIRRTAFAVPVSGDSMEPKFHDGDIALVNFRDRPEPGDIVVVTMDGLGYIKIGVTACFWFP